MKTNLIVTSFVLFTGLSTVPAGARETGEITTGEKAMTVSRKVEMLTSASSARVVDAAIRFAHDADVKVCVVVLDEAGRFLAGRCMDGVTNASYEVAMGKARHSANFRRPSKFQEDLLMEKGLLPILSVPGMLPLEGGLPIELGGIQIGAIGVSGGPSNVDGDVAHAGIAALKEST